MSEEVKLCQAPDNNVKNRWCQALERINVFRLCT